MFDRSALRIRTTEPEVPIAVGMGHPVSHDDLAKRMTPRLRGATSFPDKASHRQVFEIGCRHPCHLAPVGS